MLPKGTLIRILDDAIPPHPYSEIRRMVTNHGYLWLIDGPINGMREDGKPNARKWYWCKPLASSGIVYDWNEDEFEAAKEETE